MYREEKIKLIGLNDHTQQIGSRLLVEKAARILFVVSVYALRELRSIYMRPK
jgi:hypothetical protein